MGKPFSSSVIRSGLTKPRCSPRQFPFRSFCFCFFSPSPAQRLLWQAGNSEMRVKVLAQEWIGREMRHPPPPLLPPLPYPSQLSTHPSLCLTFCLLFPRFKFQIKTIRLSQGSLTPRAQTGKLIPSLRRKTVAMRPGRKIEETETATVCSRGGSGATKPGSLHRRGNSLRLDIRPRLRRLMRRSHGQAAQTAKRARLFQLLSPTRSTVESAVLRSRRSCRRVD